MMSKTRLLSLVLLASALVLPGPALAKKKRKKKKAQEKVSMFEHVSSTEFIGELTVERYLLKSNQLKVLLVQDPGSETIAYHTYFDVGSGDEVEGKTGLAHLFEHMMFKRTDAYDDEHFSKTIESNGGPDLNAWTWLDITAYHVSLPRTKLGMIVDLEATRMDGLIIDGGQLDAEREVVLNERRFRVDNSPEGTMNEQLWALAFEQNRYHWPTIGWADDIRGYTVEDCNAFYRDYYAPNNATIVLAGGFDRDEALAAIQEHYGAIPASDLKRLEHGDEPQQTEMRRKEMELEMESESLQWGFKVPSLVSEDRPALAVLDAVLTAGDSSRLQRRLVDSGWASSADGWMPPFQHEALYEFSVTMREGKPATAAVQILENELADLRDKPIDAEELERARAQLLAARYEQLQTASGRAGFLGFNEVSMGDWQRGISLLDAMREVTAEDVQRVAGAYFDESRSTLVVGRPKGTESASFDPAALPAIPPRSADPLPTILARPAEGQPELEVGVVQEKESMGWTRMMVYDPTLPMVWFRIVLPVGAGVEGPEQGGLANLTSEMLLRGTTSRDRETFERSLEGLGASVDVVVGTDSISLTGSALSENWPSVVTLLTEALDEPAFDQAELEALVGEIQADLVDARNNDRQLAGKFFGEGLFAGHPYGRPVLGTAESLGALTVDDVRTFHETWFTARGALLALLGNFDAGAPGDLAQLAGRLNGTLPQPAAEPASELVGPSGRSMWLVDKPDRTQVQVYLGHLAARPEGAEFAAAWLANEAFGAGGFGARMMREVREKRGWSYGAYGVFRHYRDADTYVLWVFPAIQDAIPCLELVFKLYEEFAARGISEDELAYARGSIVNSAAFYRDTPAKRLSYEVRKRLTGYDPLGLVPLVEELSLEQVNAAAASSFHPEGLFGVIVGTADMQVTLGDGEAARELSLRAALEEILGAESLEVVAYDRP